MTAIGARPALRHRLAERGVDRQLLLLLPAAAFVLVLFIYPFLYGVGLSFQPVEGGMLGAYREFFTDAYLRDTIVTTLRLSLPAALLNVLASVPIAYRMRGRFRGKCRATPRRAPAGRGPHWPDASAAARRRSWCPAAAARSVP